MSKIAQVIPAQNIPVNQNQVFSYMIPKNLQQKIKIGQEVKIPLRNKFIKGVILTIQDQQKKFKFKLKKISEIIDQNPALFPKQLELANWMMDYYYCSLGIITKLFLPKRLKRIGKYHTQKYKIEQTPFPKLTTEQNQAYNKIKNAKSNAVILLHGITGSGKTEIYLTCIRDVIKQGKQVMVLVPEIALTPQTISRFLGRFGQNQKEIVVIHSKLSKTERFLAWQKIWQNKAKIVIGPRSIVFAPYQNLGLAIIDEEHDSSYKSYDQTPRYNARDAAIKLAKIFNAKTILGSATPSLESYYKIILGEYILCELSKRYYSGEKMPNIEIINMKEEVKKKNFSLFSQKLQDELKNIQKQNRQAILFLNRRGTATFILCQDCGYVAKCKKCEVPLICHSKAKFGKKIIYSQNLTCHHCGSEENIPLTCPRCGGPKIKFCGAGTEKVEMETKEFFPKAKIRRLDTDTMNKKFVHQKAYFDFLKQKYNILIGTQMIAKGWDIPGVDLVGIILADTVLNLPDFRSSERTFQLILQVAGRTGRKDNPGKVILQTYQPENPAILTAVKYDLKTFYKQEISHREELNYPPFSQLIKITFRHKNKQKAREKIFSLHEKLLNAKRYTLDAIDIIGPAPAFIPKIRNFYIWQIILKSKISDVKLRNKLLKIIPPGFVVDVDPESLL
ncbi:MAG: primosomal protein N' [Patescibacteria group bacterium]